jgi:alpha-galactosidase
MSKPVITFIVAGSTVFARNIAGDIVQRPALANAEIRRWTSIPDGLRKAH